MDGAKLSANTESAPADQHVILRGVSWADYEKLLEIRGDGQPGVRLYYLDGDLEIMSPSGEHEWYKTTLARLLEAYADDAGIDLDGYGSLTMRRAKAERGAEPDECYVVGRAGGRNRRPDLAIEIVWTAGGLDKLTIYSGLGVRELWICDVTRGKPTVAVLALRRGRYVTVAKSRLLPGLDLDLLVRFLDGESQTRAVRGFRAALSQRRRAQ